MAMQRIKCAVVLAAGFGSRLNSDRDDCPKPLRRVGGVPLLVRVLRGLAASGIEDAGIVLGYRAEQIKEALEAEPGIGLRVHYVHNEEYAKSNGVSVLAARDFIANGAVLSMADHLYSPRVVDAVLAPEFGESACVLGVDHDIARCFDLDDATKVRVESGRIVEIGKTLSLYNALDTGVFKVGQSLVDALEGVYRSKGDCSLSDGVQALSRRGEFFAGDVDGAAWVDVDTPEAARHAAHLLEVLGEDLKGSLPLPADLVAAALPHARPEAALRRDVRARGALLATPSDAE